MTGSKNSEPMATQPAYRPGTETTVKGSGAGLEIWTFEIGVRIGYSPRRRRCMPPAPGSREHRARAGGKTRSRGTPRETAAFDAVFCAPVACKSLIFPVLNWLN